MNERERIARVRTRLDEIATSERTNPIIAPQHGTRARIFDRVAPLAVVLLHGLTNSPPQYDALGPALHERGHAVLVPRMPRHGYHDRMTDALAWLRAPELEAAALEAVALASLCGERVAVAGISVGATLALWLAARTRIDTVVAVAPFCGLAQVPGGANDALGALLRAAPNAFGWWDPRSKEAQPPPHGYPRFATRALGASLELSTRIDAAPRGDAARRAALVLNEHEPAVNNAQARRRFASLGRYGVMRETVVLEGLPHIHDIVEPAIPQAKTELVYPHLIALLEAA